MASVRSGAIATPVSSARRALRASRVISALALPSLNFTMMRDVCSAEAGSASAHRTKSSARAKRIIGCIAKRAGATRARMGSSDVEVPDAERVRLDERAARLDLLTHQRGEDVVGADDVLDLHLQEPAHARVHRGLPQLVGIHLAQPLVALLRHAAACFVEEPVERFLERLHRLLLLAALHDRAGVDESLQHVGGRMDLSGVTA